MYLILTYAVCKVSNDVNHVPQIACIVYPEDIPVEPVITSELSLSLIGDDTEEVEFWTAVKVFETIWDEKVDVVERGWVQGVGIHTFLISIHIT